MRVALATLCVVLSVYPLAAQTDTGDISGVVRDTQGGVLPGVTIVAQHLESGARIERVTDGQGRYFLASLRTGTYTITAELPGFRRTIRSGVALRLGQTIAIDFELEAGGLTEEVLVTAEQPLLRTNAEISDVIENRQVVQVPLNGRNFLSLAQLSDGVVLPPGGTRGDALQQAGPLPNVGGQRSGHNIYLLDGFKVTDELFNNLVINPSVDSIQEFKIQKSQYPAEFGGKASALINVATRTGTNQFHANVFDFGRHDRFDARNYFAPKDQPVPPLRQNQFGGTVGGPIVKNSTFFFASYEGQRIRRSLTRTFSVPSAAVRAGEYGSFRIPHSQIDPIATAFLQHVPLPNGPGESQNLTATEPQVNNVDQISVRLDRRLATADQLFARFSTFDASDRQPFGTGSLQETLVPGFGRTVKTSARNIGISHTHVFGSKVMNELRAGWLRVKGGQVSANRGVDFAGQVGLQGVTRDPRDTGFPQISTAGLYSTMGDPTSFIYRRNEHLELYENLLVDRGAHHVKFGAYLFHLRFNPEQPDNARGAFSYTGQFTGNAFADFLLGYPTSAVSGIGRGSEDARTNWVHLFAQDDWRARSNITVNAGLRYEYNQHMHDIDNRLSSIDVAGRRFVIASDDAGKISDEARALLGVMPLPYVTSSEAGWNRGLLRPSRLRLAPRSGVALSFDNNRAVLRGGYGIFLNQWAYSVQTAFTRNLPFFFAKEVALPSDVRVPQFQTRDILARDPTSVVSPMIMTHDYAVEYTQTWSGGLQYELAPETMVEANYMGSWTVGADNATIDNVPLPGPGSIQARRPIPQLGSIRTIRFDGRSIYHAATFSAVRRLRDSYAYNVSYTLSISKDDASNPGPTESEANVPQNVRDIFSDSGEWALSSFDHRHVFTASGTWEIAGWRISPVFLAQSGAPFTVNLGVDQANIGAGPAQRPDQLRDPNLPVGQRSPDRWFDTSAFALPAPYTFGSVRRNSVIGPGFSSTDLSVARTWKVGGSRELEVRWEIFNLFNKANFDVPNRIFGTPNFGRIFSAKDPREMQFGVKMNF